MSTVSQSVRKVRELLFGPLPQSPSVKQVFGAVLREFNNFHNELANTNQNWSTADFNLNLNGQGDFKIAGNVGKILFVSGDYGSVEFVDLSDASANPWFYDYRVNALDYYNTYYGAAQIAFYRKDNSLYARSVRNGCPYGCYKITAAIGDWSSQADTDSLPVLSQYHHLPEIRAAKNLIPSCRWSGEIDKRDLRISLDEQEARVLPLFREAKRNLVVDDVSWREVEDF